MNRETLANDSSDQPKPNDAQAGQEQTDEAIAQQDLEEYLTGEKYDYHEPQRGDIQSGVVIEFNERGVIVDAGFKRDGFVYADDLERLDEETRSNIQVGDTVPVSVVRPQNKEGRLILSIYKAYVYEDWVKAKQMMEDGELYEGEISDYNRGGLLIPFGRIRGFIPASHALEVPRGLQGEERRQHLEDMVGKEVGLRIIEVDRRRRRLILSEREARRSWQRMQRERVMEELTVGETRHGKVTGITDFGAFVDLGGADGLIHISELSWKQVDDTREVVNVGDEVDVYILDLDWERKRIALSLRRLQPNPWTQVDEHYGEGELVEGEITRVLDFGAFVKLDLGVEGLLHVSEMSGASELNPSEIVQSGEQVLVKIISIDSRRERMALSAKQVHRNEWETWVAEHQTPGEGQEEDTGPEKVGAETVEQEPSAPEEQTTVSAAGEEESAAAETETSEQPAEEEAGTPEEDAAAEEEARALDRAEEETAEKEGTAASGVEPGTTEAPEQKSAAAETGEQPAEEETGTPEEDATAEEEARALERAEEETAEEEGTAASEVEPGTTEAPEEKSAAPETDAGDEPAEEQTATRREAAEEATGSTQTAAPDGTTEAETAS